jgi:minor extracellular protease Epr
MATTGDPREYSLTSYVVVPLDHMPRSFHKTRIFAFATCLIFGGLQVALAKDEPREARDTDRRESNSGSGSRDSRDSDDRIEDRSGSGSNDDRDDDRDDEDHSGSDGRDSDDGDSDSRSGGSESKRRSTRVDVERKHGGDRQRAEVLMIGPDDDVASVRNAGFVILSERRLESLAQTILRVQVRSGESVEQLAESLRLLAPRARIAANHIYRPSQTTGDREALVHPQNGVTRKAAVQSATIGVIDTGAELHVPLLRNKVVMTRGLAAGGYQARLHGTAVAQLAALDGASIAVIDVFGLDRNNQLAASAELIAAGIDLLMTAGISIINISIEGPDNAVLEYVVQSAVKNGVAIVAAAGNGGPNAQATFPAAYPGVIAVTALDEKGQVYRRAARGPYIAFAARGVFSRGQELIQSPEPLAGTSFAAPLIAAELAGRRKLDPDASREQLVDSLRRDAVDLGTPGRDPIYGWGRIASIHDTFRQQANR